MNITLVIHLLLFGIIIAELIEIIISSHETRSHWIVFLLLTGMCYAIVGYLFNRNETEKSKQE